MPNLNFKNVEYMCMETIEAQDRAAANSAVANNRKGFKDVAASESICEAKLQVVNLRNS